MQLPSLYICGNCSAAHSKANLHLDGVGYHGVLWIGPHFIFLYVVHTVLCESRSPLCVGGRNGGRHAPISEAVVAQAVRSPYIGQAGNERARSLCQQMGIAASW